MGTFGKISHICFDVENIEEAVEFYSKTLGTERPMIQSMEISQGKGLVKTAFLRLEGVDIELAEHHLPASWGDSPLRTRPGFHHIAFASSRFDEEIQDLMDKGIKPLPGFPMATDHGRVAFLDPGRTGGVLWELAEEEDSE